MPSACRTLAIKREAQCPRFWVATLLALPGRPVAGRGAAEPRDGAARRSNEAEGLGGASSARAIAVAGAGGAGDGVTCPGGDTCCVRAAARGIPVACRVL